MFVAIVAIVIAACAMVMLGCESREGKQFCVWCPDNVSVDTHDDVYSDDTTSDDFVAEQDIGPPEDVLTAAEACTPYLGVWDCECTEGSCDIGGHVFYLIELMQANGNGTWTLFASQMPNGNSGPLTCDPLHMPPSDYEAVTFEITSDNNAKWTLQNWYILECTRAN